MRPQYHTTRYAMPLSISWSAEAAAPEFAINMLSRKSYSPALRASISGEAAHRCLFIGGSNTTSAASVAKSAYEPITVNEAARLAPSQSCIGQKQAGLP